MYDVVYYRNIEDYKIAEMQDNNTSASASSISVFMADFCFSTRNNQIKT